MASQPDHRSPAWEADAYVKALSKARAHNEETLIRQHFRETPLYLQAMLDSSFTPCHVVLSYTSGTIEGTLEAGYRFVNRMQVTERVS